jgi:hypothetical protein
MIKSIAHKIKSTWFNFPLQLLILHFKKHQLMLLLWAFFFASILNGVGVHYGIPYLFLDPEYRNKVDFFSFLIVGFSIGGFIMAWQISYYMLNSFRFQFLASLSHPFITFCLNNSIIPLTFIACYTYQVLNFEKSENLEKGVILSNMMGLYLGIFSNILLTSLYFLFFNKNVNLFLKTLKEKTKEKLKENHIDLDILPEKKELKDQWPVEVYLSSAFRWKLARNVSHYDPWIINRILKSHHYNAFVVILVSFTSLFLFGSLIENPLFRIPAAGSLCLLFTTFMVISAGLTYFFGEWRVMAVLVIFGGITLMSQFNLMIYRNKVPGMNYERTPIPYNQSAIEASVTRSNMLYDIQETKKILDKWKQNMFVKYGESKPKLILFSTGGGGCKSSYWTTMVLQKTDQSLNGKLFDHCVLITGASGGMWGAAYYRELYLRQKTNQINNLYDTIYAEDAGKDLLNGIMAAGASNDIFFPWRTYTINESAYKKDRAYAFDLHLNENTRGFMDKKLMDYYEPERNAEIPMMIFSPVITNDQRTLFISPQPISYLTNSFIHQPSSTITDLAIDGIDFMSYFQDYGAENLNFIAALRIQASFPYVFPSTNLPSTPKMKVMDAGLKENLGLGVSTRFFSVFKNWIEENTSGVVFLQLRTDPKYIDLSAQETTNIISETTNPIGNIYSNFMNLQDYNNDIFLGFIKNMTKTQVHFIPISYEPTLEKQEAAMSIHITSKDKADLRASYYNAANQEALKKLEKILE